MTTAYPANEPGVAPFPSGAARPSSNVTGCQRASARSAATG